VVIILKTKNIKQSIVFKATPHEVYEALMDSRKHAQFTGSEAEISPDVGGEFRAWGGYIMGVNLELIPDEKIVQSWRAEEICWPNDHYSTVTITLKKERGGTRLTFNQEGVPEECYENIEKGWHDFYWKPMKVILEKK
jgi:activator of HSP90 ATPase